MSGASKRHPANNGKVMLTAWVEPALRDYVRSEARRTGLSMSALIESAVRALIRNTLAADQCAALWRKLQALDADILQWDHPQELVDAELREMGVDPEALAARGAAFVAGLKEKR